MFDTNLKAWVRKKWQQGEAYSRNKAEILTGTARQRHTAKSAITSAQRRYENSGIKLAMGVFLCVEIQKYRQCGCFYQNIIATKLQAL